jgi:hypothetical protein
MTSTYSGHTDARRSHFHNVGQDQYNVCQTIHITIADFTPEQMSPRVQPIAKKRSRYHGIDNVSLPADNNDDGDQASRLQHKQRKLSPNVLPHKLDEVSQWPSPSTQTSSQTRAAAQPYDAETSCATDLIIKIVQLLLDCGESQHYYRILEWELEPLCQTLTLTELALHTYEGTPLGQNLANSINPKVAQICVVLQELFDKIDSYRQGLKSTFICAMWYQVWRSRHQLDGLASLRMKLCDCQKSLGEFLMALNS